MSVQGNNIKLSFVFLVILLLSSCIGIGKEEIGLFLDIFKDSIYYLLFLNLGLLSQLKGREIGNIFLAFITILKEFVWFFCIFFPTFKKRIIGFFLFNIILYIICIVKYILCFLKFYLYLEN